MDGNVRFRLGFALLAGALAMVAFQACKADGGSTSEPGTTGAATGATPSKPADPATPNPVNTGFGVPLAANKCPSAAPGSTTSVKELPDGVEVTVTAPGGTPINDIRSRGVQIVEASKAPAIGASDGLAKCPIVVKDTVITETDIPGGAAFTIKPTKPTGLDALKKEAKARAADYKPEVAK